MAEKEKGIKWNKIIPEQGFSSDVIKQFTQGVIDGNVKVSAIIQTYFACIFSSACLFLQKD